MASLSNFGIPGVGSGILHPILKNRFRIAFHDDNGVKLPYSDELAMQAVKVSSFLQGNNSFGLTSSDTVVVTLQDDVTCRAARAVQELFNIPSGNFKFIVEYLDGNEGLIRTATFSFCRLATVEHGELDYAGGSSRERLRLNIPHREGSLIDALKENPAALAIMTLLNGASMSVTDPESNATVETTLSISYETVELTFPEL